LLVLIIAERLLLWMLLECFFDGRSFVFNDFTISNRELINKIGAQRELPDCEKPESISNWSNLLPSMDVWLDVGLQDIHHVISIIPPSTGEVD